MQATSACAQNSDVRPEELVLCLFNDLNSGNFQGNDKLPICGFNNIGNGCFLNASLQVLFACRPLQAFLEVWDSSLFVRTPVNEFSSLRSSAGAEGRRRAHE